MRIIKPTTNQIKVDILNARQAKPHPRSIPNLFTVPMNMHKSQSFPLTSWSILALFTSTMLTVLG